MQGGLKIANLSKTFGQVTVLHSAALAVPGGEITALVGQNGSGKSTIVKILAGIHEPDAGAEISVDGADVRLGSVDAARHAGFRFVHQNLGLVGAMTVAENFNLADNGRGRFAPVSRQRERDKVEDVLGRLGYRVRATDRIKDLSASERTAVAIGRAISSPGEMRLLVLDEPTASMPSGEVSRLFGAMTNAAQSGIAVLFISHHLDEVLDIADNITVLRDGRVVETTRASGMNKSTLTKAILGRDPEDLATNDLEVKSTEKPVLDVKNLKGGSLHNLSFSCRPGEILGIAGLTGTGREDVCALISGLVMRAAGEVSVSGSAVDAGSLKSAFNSGMHYVTADRLRYAMFGSMSVSENLTISDLRPFRTRLLTVGRRQETKAVREWVRGLDIRPADPKRAISQLSGGNQQKVVLARILRLEPKVILLDDPTQGVDVGAKSVIHERIIEAAANGAAVVVSSSDPEELAQICQRVLVLGKGAASEVVLRGSEVTSDRIVQEELMNSASDSESAK